MASRNASPNVTAQLSTNPNFGLHPNPVLVGPSRVGNSRTWSYASGELEKLDVADNLDDRSIFVDEYNRLAEKLELRPLDLEDLPQCIVNQQDASPRRASWFTRKFRRLSSAQSPNTTSDTIVRRKRSIGDVASQLVHTNKDSFKNEDLQGLIQLCGKSFLYLPSEYAPCPLILPTPLRATANYLIQHAITTPGTFRIPGALRVVNEIYEYYCAERNGDEITGTVRNPNLPSHLQVSVHDVASAFKKFLSGLPGGILGSLSLFDALVAIESQHHGNSDIERNRRDKLRARLIALAVGTVRSQFRRELICAVFGMLCLLGQEAQMQTSGHGQVASDMMGFNAFGIVFGPLLVGDLLDSYTMKLSAHSSGLVLLPNTPPATRKHRKKSSSGTELSPSVLTMNKIRVANDVTEMLITDWLEVVKNMKSLNILRSDSWAPKCTQEKVDKILKTSDSDPFVRRKPLKSYGEVSRKPVQGNTDATSHTHESRPIVSKSRNEAIDSGLEVKRVRPKSFSPSSNPSPAPAPKTSVLLLSPMAQMAEKPSYNSPLSPRQHEVHVPSSFKNITNQTKPATDLKSLTKESLQTPREGTEFRDAKSPPNPGVGGRNSLQTTLRPLTGNQVSLHGQGENVDPRLSHRRKVSNNNPPVTRSPFLEEQSMGWLGDYLNLEEASRTLTESTPNSYNAAISNSRRSFVTPSSGKSREASSRVKVPLSKNHFGINERNHHAQTQDGLRAHVVEKDNAEIQESSKLPRQNLSRARSKTVSTPPVTPWNLPSSITTDRKHARKSIGGAVRAMAAMFDNAAKASSVIPTPAGKARLRRTSKIFNGLSTYTVNPSPTRSSCSNRSELSHTTSNQPNRTSQGPHHGLVRERGQQETPTRQPLRSSLANDTDTLLIAQSHSQEQPSMRNEDVAKSQAKPLRLLDQTQGPRVQHPTAQLPRYATPRLVSRELQTTEINEQTKPHQVSDIMGSSPGALNRNIHSKEQECDSLKIAVDARDHDIAILKEELAQTRAESSVWQRRAETAERQVEFFKSRATKTKEVSRSSADKETPLRVGLSLRASSHRVDRSSSSAYSRDGLRGKKTSFTSSTVVDTPGTDHVQPDTSSEWSER